MKKWLLCFILLFAFVALPTISEANSFREVKVVTGSSLVVKNAASPSAASIATLKRGDFVTIFSTTNGWAKIQSKTISGFVNASFLGTAPSTIKIASSKSGLVVKQSPSRSAKTLATLQYNMIVEDFGSVGAGWSFVQYGNVTGYVASNFIGTPKMTTQYVNVDNLIVRNIASPSGAQKATLTKGIQVNVHSTIAGWAFVSAGNTRGYVVASQLSTSKPVLLKGQKIHQNQFSGDIRFTTTLRDTNGQAVQLHFLSYGDYGRYATEDDLLWAGLGVGDLYYEGDFKIGLQAAGEPYIYVQPYSFNDYTYNKTMELVYKVQGKTVSDADLFVVSEVCSSNCREAEVFYMMNGQLKRADTIGYTSKPKSIGNSEYQTMSYSNAEDTGYHFNTFKLNKTTGAITHVRTRSYINDNWDEGQRIHELWLNNPNYVVK